MSEEQKTPNPIERHRSLGEALKELFTAVRKWFFDLVNLDEGADPEGTIIAIHNNKRMRGSNAWLLICSIMIASLGLDLNSPAVIIGAMLISPLMSPILGIGMAIGINDRETLFISLQHFGIAIAIALITSTFYFAITPLGEFTDEIQARTAPTLLDGLVAIFGGLAGIISATRKDKSNAIPGVAIATALMPPLCVTGYGLSHGNWTVMINSFYLFFLNSFFITLTTYVIIRLLNFPMKSYQNRKEARRTRALLIIFSLIIIIPSTRILFNLLVERQENRKVQAFIDDYFGPGKPTKCIDYSLIFGDSTNQLILELLGKSIPEDSLTIYYSGLQEYKVENTTLSIIQDSDIGLDRINKLQSELNSLGELANQFETIQSVKNEQELKMENLQIQIDSLIADTIPFQQICQEAKIFIPEIQKMGFAKATTSDFKTDAFDFPILLVEWPKNMNRYTRREAEKKLLVFVKNRAQLDTLQIVRY